MQFVSTGLAQSSKNFGTLLSSSFSDVYENLYFVKSKSFPITSAHKFLCTHDPWRAINVAKF